MAESKIMYWLGFFSEILRAAYQTWLYHYRCFHWDFFSSLKFLNRPYIVWEFVMLSIVLILIFCTISYLLFGVVFELNEREDTENRLQKYNYIYLLGLNFSMLAIFSFIFNSACILLAWVTWLILRMWKYHETGKDWLYRTHIFMFFGLVLTYFAFFYEIYFLDFFFTYIIATCLFRKAWRLFPNREDEAIAFQLYGFLAFWHFLDLKLGFAYFTTYDVTFEIVNTPLTAGFGGLILAWIIMVRETYYIFYLENTINWLTDAKYPDNLNKWIKRGQVFFFAMIICASPKFIYLYLFFIPMWTVMFGINLFYITNFCYRARGFYKHYYAYVTVKGWPFVTIFLCIPFLMVLFVYFFLLWGYADLFQQMFFWSGNYWTHFRIWVELQIR